MSTTVLSPTRPISSSISMSMMTSTCTHCGHDVPTPDEAHVRIKDLEAQVRLLNTKAAAAVDKLADYEDEVRSLRAAYTQLQEQNQPQKTQPPLPSSQSPHPQPSSSAIQATSEQPSTLTPSITPPVTTTPPNPSSPPHRPTQPSRLASLSSFLPGRKRDTTILNPQPTTPLAAFFSQQQTSPPPRTATLDSTSSHQTHQQPPLTLLSLQQTLETERHLRQQAESTLTQTQVELEELTATLFGQANEMVATERKARAKLEERVKVLEDRDGEKRKRLERLERALERIERVRVLVGGGKEKDKARNVVEVEEGALRVVNT